jgi:hypothetical protein
LNFWWVTVLAVGLPFDLAIILINPDTNSLSLLYTSLQLRIKRKLTALPEEGEEEDLT